VPAERDARGTTTDVRFCDVAIIGAGSAGMAAHAAASKVTGSVLLVEGGEYGTTCARNGCMPSKLLLAAADAKHHVDDAATFGLRVGAVEVDGAAVMQRVRTMRDEFVAGVVRAIERIPATQRLHGSARFVAPGELHAGGVTLRPRAIVLATGSHPFVPEAFAGLGDRLLTSDSIFELDTLPDSIAVVGGGPIGLELGQALHRLGARVRLFERGLWLGPTGDEALAVLATQLLSATLPCELGTEPWVQQVDDNGVLLCWRDGDGSQHDERFQYVLVAAGRRANLVALDLANSGLQLDPRGLPVFDPQTLRCGDSNVFIAGDVNGERPLLHEAAGEGRIAGDNAARWPEVRAARRWVPMAVAFTEPQFATLGDVDSDAADVAVGEVSFARQGRSRVVARAAGMLRIYAERPGGRLIGARMIGPAVEHLAHLLAWAIEQRLTVADALAMPFYHPVIEEGVRTALRDLRHALQREPTPAPLPMDCGPGT
jgi:dihydrolipoamide dehydrogenase